MKISRAAILAVVLGVATGLGITALRLALSPWDGNPATASTNSDYDSTGQSEGLAPRIVVKQTKYDFGKMDVKAESRHDFIFANQGDRELVLEKGPTSCKCAGLLIERTRVPPGRSTKVTLKWNAEGATDNYQEKAVVLTNDPHRRRVILTVSGRVIESVRSVPPVLLFHYVSAHESTTKEVPLYCFLDKPMQIRSVKLENTWTAPYFHVECGDPLTPEQLAEQPDAVSGYLVRVTLKPGLPLGIFRQKILLETNLASVKSVAIPVQGTVTGDIKIAGRDWNSEARLLRLGTVNSQEGALRKLYLFARGRHCQKVHFEIDQVRPADLLHVKLGRRTENNRNSIQTTLLIEIPKGSPPANLISSQRDKLGLIVVKTGHPETPKLTIYVSFAVKPPEG